jgi:uncharacterized protein YbjT (DUF2867 family)
MEGMTSRTALVAGASGLVGGFLLDELLASPLYQQVHSLGRRALPREHPRLTQRTVDFTRLEDEPLPPAEDAFCCLGTTIKKAGSREAFRAVDHDAVLAFARTAQRAGARRLLVVTAQGADPRSRIFYSRVKGEVEQALQALGLESLFLLRPWLLLGERNERRPGEQAAILASKALGPLLRPLLPRPIEARTVARAMLALAREAPRGVQIALSEELQELGR